MTEQLAIGPGMARALRHVAALCDAPTRAVVTGVLRARSGAPAEIIDGGIDAATRLIAATLPPELVIVDIDAAPDVAASIEALANVCAPETRVIVVGSLNDILLYRRLIAAGVADYLVKPLAPERLAASIDAALATQRGSGARVVAMIGARGGVGTSALALSAGWTLAQQCGQRVVLLDLDLHFGALALGLDVVPGPGLRDLLANPDRVDATLIDAALLRVDGSKAGDARLALLAAEVPLEAETGSTAAGVAALLAALAGSADTIIIDLPRQLDAVTRGLLRTVDSVAIVSDFTLAGLRDTQRLVRLAAGLRAGARPLVIANRSGRDAPGQLTRAAFEAALGVGCDLEIAEDPVAARAAALDAGPLAASARSAAPWQALAALLGGVASAAAPRASLWQRLQSVLR